MFPQLLVSGISIGSCYAVVSVGMAILLQATTVLNFAHGENVMLGAFLMLTFYSLLRINLLLSIIFTLIVCYIAGNLMYKLVFSKLVNAPHVNIVLATNGFLFFYRGISRMIWHSEPRFTPLLLDIPSFNLLGAIITSQDIFILLSVFIFAIIFLWIFFSTEAGLKMRATAQSLRGASLVGINTDKFSRIIWATSVGIGAFAGILLGPVFSVHPDVGESLLLRSFAALVLGGFGNILGAAIGGILIGIVENMVAFYIWSSLREIVAYIVIVFVLLIKPTGILGVRKEKIEIK